MYIYIYTHIYAYIQYIHITKLGTHLAAPQDMGAPTLTKPNN